MPNHQPPSGDAPPFIDAHVHLMGLAGIDMLMEVFRQQNLSKMNIVCLADNVGFGFGFTPMSLLCKALHPRQVYVSGGLRYGPPNNRRRDFADQARLLRKLGCDGIKMIEGKPTIRRETGLALDDPAYDEYYAFLEAQAIPIFFHVGDPPTFWDPKTIPSFAAAKGWGYWEGGYPTLPQLRAEVDGVLKKFPRLKIIFAHFYFLSEDLPQAAAFLDRWPGVSFDLTPGSEMYVGFTKQPQAWRDFFIRYQDRIVFGTDNMAPKGKTVDKMIVRIQHVRKFLETREIFEGFNSTHIQSIALEKPVLEKIYYRNAERYVGSQPRPLDLNLAGALALTVIDDAVAAGGDAVQIDELRETLRQLKDLA